MLDKVTKKKIDDLRQIIVGKVYKAPYSIDTAKDLKFFLKSELIKWKKNSISG